MVDRSTYRSRALLAAVVLVAPTALAMTAVAENATAATAQAGSLSVSDAKVTSRSESVTVSAKVPALEHGDLGIVAPGADKATEVASGDGGLTGKTLTYTFTPKRNGTWKAVFDNSLAGLLKDPSQTRSIVVAAAPAKPSGLVADATSRTVTARWNKGSEPDLTSYRVTAGGTSKRLGVGSACGGSTCRASLPAPAGGGRTVVTVTANRSSPEGTRSSTPASTSVHVPTAHSNGGSGASRVPGSAGGGGSSGGIPTPKLSGGRYAGVPPGSVPGSALGSGPAAAPDPYPSFGLRPKVAPLAANRRDHAVHPLVEPLSAGSSMGSTAVPVALGLVFVLTMAHIWLWTRSGRRLRPMLAAGAHRVALRFRR